MQQLKAYNQAVKLLTVDQANFESCKQAKIAYDLGKMKDAMDDVYEESGVAYAICLKISKPFRAINQNPTQLGYKILNNLDRNYNYEKARKVIQLFNQDIEH